MKCAAPQAGFFSTEGEPVCRYCFNTAEIEKSDAAIPGPLIKSGVAAIAVALIGFACIGALGARGKLVRRLAAVPALAMVSGVICLREGLSRRRAQSR